MVQAQIEIQEHTNRVINIVKAKYGAKNKSEAIDIMAEQFEQEILEPELKPEYIKKLKQIQKHGKYTRVKDVEKLLGLK